MAENLVVTKDDMLKQMENGSQFSISFYTKSGELKSIEYAKRTRLPRTFRAKKNFIGIADLDEPESHVYPAFLYLIESFNSKAVAW